ncbi:hypothetical protein V6Z12_A12G278100 [Gossypium hirsutum]
MREQCINGHFAIGLYHYNVHRESLKPREGLTNGHSFSRNRLKHRTRHNSVALDKLTLVAMNNSCQDNYVPIRRDSSVHVIFKAIRWRSQPIQQTRRMPERYALDTLENNSRLSPILKERIYKRRNFGRLSHHILPTQKVHLEPNTAKK